MPKSAPRHSDRRRAMPDRREHQPWRKWYSTAQWRKLAAMVRREEPLCRECTKRDRTTATAVVDHIVPHRGNRELFFDRDNLQGLCKECHDFKTGKGM